MVLEAKPKDKTLNAKMGMWGTPVDPAAGRLGQEGGLRLGVLGQPWQDSGRTVRLLSQKQAGRAAVDQR